MTGPFVAVSVLFLRGGLTEKGIDPQPAGQSREDLDHQGVVAVRAVGDLDVGIVVHVRIGGGRLPARAPEGAGRIRVELGVDQLGRLAGAALGDAQRLGDTLKLTPTEFGEAGLDHAARQVDARITRVEQIELGQERLARSGRGQSGRVGPRDQPEHLVNIVEPGTIRPGDHRRRVLQETVFVQAGQDIGRQPTMLWPEVSGDLGEDVHCQVFRRGRLQVGGSLVDRDGAGGAG